MDQVQEAKGELEQEGKAHQSSNTATNPKIGNVQLPKLEMNNESDESQDDEQGNTPFSDARTDISPPNEDGDLNLSISTQNGELPEEIKLVPNKNIFQEHSDREGSIHSYTGYMENEEVLIFKQQNEQIANLLGASEVEQTVREVLQYEIAENGNLILEVSPNTPEILNKTVVERPLTNPLQRRSGRIVAFVTSADGESSGSSRYQGNSDPTNPQTPKRKRPLKMSPELAAKKKVNDGPLIKHLRIGSKAATEALVGRGLYTKDEHNKVRKQQNAAALESEGTKQCECGGTEEDHSFLTDINDITFKIECIGSILQTEAKTGRKLASNRDSLRAKGAIERSEEDQSY
ncbi:hypothetical protein JTB14_007017 [Gonioctena quinquepunctata]|nr:hypothetical protein JTB14_007017 [Gonioctena quinquepunctata]